MAGELGALAKAGLVTVSGYEVRCCEARCGAEVVPAGPRGGTRETGAEGRMGGGGEGEGRGSAGTCGGAARVGVRGGAEEGGTGRQTRTLAGKQRRATTEYAESEQESEESEAGDWD